MAFVKEDVPDSGPKQLADEHQRLLAWMKAHRVGVIEYLNHRMVDFDVPAALYYIEGFGMGRGSTFAVVRGDDIYVVSVCWTQWAFPPDDPYVSNITIPEDSTWHRGAIQELLADALKGYYKEHSLGFEQCEKPWTLDWSKARWVIQPRKYSRLYWRTEAAKRWPRIRTRWLNIWSAVSSPLVATLAFAGFAWTDSLWPMTFAGVWLALRLQQHNSTWRLDAWMLGRKKLSDPEHHLKVIARMMHPLPLAVLKVLVERQDGDPTTRVVRVVNQALFPVPFVSIGSGAIAALLAPGFFEALQREQPQLSAADLMKEEERKFPTMTKNWLWPRQSFASRYQLLADFPPTTQTREVKAMVSIPRFVSGNSHHGLSNFLLEVEHISH